MKKKTDEYIIKRAKVEMMFVNGSPNIDESYLEDEIRLALKNRGIKLNKIRFY